MKGKWLLTAVMSSLLVASAAHATIARQAVLGSQPVFTTPAGGSGVVTNAVNGSLWYDDDYNVFYNPAYVNENKNFAVVQKSLEGGWFKGEFENFAYGIYVNRGGTGNAGTNYAGNLVAPGLRSRTAFLGAANTTTPLNTQRPIELFLAGDTGIKWGFHATWAYNRDQSGATAPNNGDAEVTNRYWHFDLGAEVMGFEPFIGATLFSKYQNDLTSLKATQELNEFNVGTRYKYEGWTPYVTWKKYREGGAPVGFQRQVQTRMNILGLGVSHDTKVADGVHIMKNLGFWYNSVEDDTPVFNNQGGATTPTGLTLSGESQLSYKHVIVPLNMSIEAEATSWLTLRAGATFDIINEQKYAKSNATASLSVNDKQVSQAGSATFRIGSTVKFGKLAVDSAFGTGQAVGGTTSNTASLDTTNFGFDSQTFALLGATYRW